MRESLRKIVYQDPEKTQLINEDKLEQILEQLIHSEDAEWLDVDKELEEVDKKNLDS